MKNVIVSFIVAAVGLASSCPVVHADLTGFTPGTFVSNQHDSQTPAALVPGGVQITNSSSGEFRSIWFNARQEISSFSCSFSYRLGNFTATGPNQGVAFVVQNSAAGTSWVSNGGFPTNVGYANLDHSAAITLESSSGTGISYSGYYTSGAWGGTSPAILPINAFFPADIHVSIVYDGSILTVDMEDGIHAPSVQQLLVGSIANTIGGSSTAWIGFVAGTGGGAEQTITDFSFTAAPTPGAAAILGLGLMVCPRRRR